MTAGTASGSAVTTPARNCRGSFIATTARSTRAGRQFLDAPSPGGYLEEWTRRLADPIEESTGDQIGLLTFRLAEEWLALPVSVLVEVTAPRPLHRVPHRGGILAGLVNIRGELHLCVHLDKVLNLERDSAPSPLAPQPRLLVVRHEADRWAFPVDEVDQVQRLPLHRLTPPPATLRRSLARLTRGVFHQDGGSIGLIDDDRLFATLRARMR